METEKGGWILYSIVLTCNRSHQNMTDEEAKKVIQRFLNALRRRAKQEEQKAEKTGNGKGWKYYIFVGYSRSNQKLKSEKPHFHVLLAADPGWRVAEWCNNYWNPPQKSKRERIGIVKKKRLEGNNIGYFRDVYIRDQSEFVREQRLGI